ncbi:MAG: DUF3419 family protein [Parvibaculaceae bacterium]
MSRPIADGRGLSLELKRAVHRHRAASMGGVLERLFTLAFSGLVYPQIWEDPVVDMEAMALEPGQRIVAIASAGCNVLSYLSREPGSVLAVDLNPAHIALNRLKLAAARYAPTYEDFLRFFGEADRRENLRLYDKVLRRRLDLATRDYWDGRDILGRRRIGAFGRGFYRHGLLGRFIGAAHLASRLCGLRPQEILEAATVEAQAELFERKFAPLFDRPAVRRLLDRRLALYGLGIPPAQFDRLANGRPMAEVLKERLRKLACDFPLKENYFAWQAFGRSYGLEAHAALPPYLERAHFETVRRNAHRVQPVRGSLTAVLAEEPARSIDRYVLLDAQDWMSGPQLDALWSEITRTARDGARVIFRTADEADILFGALSSSLRAHWRYEAEKSRDLTARDRSAVYGAFHLYCLEPLS